MKRFLNSNIKLKICIGFGLAFLAFIVVQHLSNQSIQNLKASEKEMFNSHQLSKKLGIIVYSINAYEGKISDFVLTGNKLFLSGNEDNLNDASINLQYIKDLKKNEKQTLLITTLDSLLQQEINYCQQNLIAYDNINRNEVNQLINSGSGHKLLNDIQKTSNEIQDMEESNVVRIMNNNESYSRKVAFMDDAATLFALAVILISIFILFRDINKRIEVEHQLRVAQGKAEQSAVMKEQFMANMSHEIRTPMNAIIGFADLLSKSKLDEKQKRQVNAIHSSGENLLVIINDILDFSKIEAGMVNIEQIPFSLIQLLHSVNVMFLPIATSKKISLEFYTQASLPAVLLGDPSRLTQILINLISNAIKFTSEGKITVKTELLRKENDTFFIQFSVKDTGIGIPSDKIDDIFERFTQANSDTSRKYGGSGLGLTITKKLIELQNGTITVSSAPGVGSSFVFVVPYKLSMEPVGKLKKEDSNIKLNQKATVLVAEDNLLNQYLISSLLTEFGLTFDLVENGNLAIEKLKERQYDLLLMDIQMPEMNGYDTAEFIRKNMKLTLPIIAMTAHVLPGEKAKCLSYGMTDYIAKPIRENELYELINNYIKTKDPNAVNGNVALAPAKNNMNITNLTYVKELANGNSAFFNNMIRLFITENPIEVQRLEDAIQKKDYNMIYNLAHKMKSTISFVGLDLTISNELTKMEEFSMKKENLPEIEKLFIKVKESCLKAIEELKALNKDLAL